jgi:hypothetical protein
MRNYLPSNGTDGVWFTQKYCDKCYKESQCTILTNAYCGGQPKQWIYDENNHPVCTSFNPNRPKRKKRQITQGSTLF